MNGAESPVEPAPTERFPFWGYADLLFFAGMTVPSLLLGAFIVRCVVALGGWSVRSRVVELLPAQFLGYAILFGFLYALFRFQYGRPFWQSLSWTRPPVNSSSIVLLGIVLAFAVAFAGSLLKTPDIDSPMKQLLSSPQAIFLIAIFGTTLGPLFEELAFRGFLQPLLVRSFGAAPGILIAAAAFGVLHLQEYGFSWRHGLLITGAGAAFGWMRHQTGSTFASTLMHSAYNLTFFIVLVAQRKELSHTW